MPDISSPRLNSSIFAQTIIATRSPSWPTPSPPYSMPAWRSSSTPITSLLMRSVLSRRRATPRDRSEEHTSELQSLMRISYAVFCLKKKTIKLVVHIQQRKLPDTQTPQPTKQVHHRTPTRHSKQ